MPDVWMHNRSSLAEFGDDQLSCFCMISNRSTASVLLWWWWWYNYMMLEYVLTF